MIAIDPAAPAAPSQQIRQQIADLIHAGQMPAGQRLPSIRQLAADLRVAPGTVAKAYSLLEGDALVVTSRARGTRVAAEQARADDVNEAAARYVASLTGVGLDEALSAVRAAWNAAQR